MRDDPKDIYVPCDGCTRCCKRDAVRLLPGDPVKKYKVEPHPKLKGQWMLAHRPNGDCWYLGRSGCTIHDRRPHLCREMDCRNIARAYTLGEAHRLGLLVVWDRGWELIRSEG